jgi:hypothetical protein
MYILKAQLIYPQECSKELIFYKKREILSFYQRNTGLKDKSLADELACQSQRSMAGATILAFSSLCSTYVILLVMAPDWQLSRLRITVEPCSAGCMFFPVAIGQALWYNVKVVS